MTRINVGIDPREIPKKYLLAEHREIKRIPNCIKSGRFKLISIPSEFKLGTGHVRFFIDKLAYLKRRYIAIYNQCIALDCNVENYLSSFDNISEEYFNDYFPTNRDRNILLQRFSEKTIHLVSVDLRDKTL